MVTGQRRPFPSTAVTEAGADHVRLSYQYLDEGDLDAYGSLLADDVRLDLPGTAPGRGREEVLRALGGAPPGRHEVLELVAAGDRVTVTGRYTERGGSGGGFPPLGFIDFFDLSEHGLILACRRRYDEPG